MGILPEMVLHFGEQIKSKMGTSFVNSNKVGPNIFSQDFCFILLGAANPVGFNELQEIRNARPVMGWLEAFVFHPDFG